MKGEVQFSVLAETIVDKMYIKTLRDKIELDVLLTHLRTQSLKWPIYALYKKYPADLSYVLEKCRVEPIGLFFNTTAASNSYVTVRLKEHMFKEYNMKIKVEEMKAVTRFVGP